MDEKKYIKRAKKFGVTYKNDKEMKDFQIKVLTNVMVYSTIDDLVLKAFSELDGMTQFKIWNYLCVIKGMATRGEFESE